VIASHLNRAAARYISRCRLAGDARTYEQMLCDILPLNLAAALAANLLRGAWRS
jgi:hypothetical protein